MTQLSLHHATVERRADCTAPRILFAEPVGTRRADAQALCLGGLTLNVPVGNRQTGTSRLPKRSANGSKLDKPARGGYVLSHLPAAEMPCIGRRIWR